MIMITSVRPALASDAASLASVNAATSRSAPMALDVHSPGLSPAHYAELIEKNAGLVYVAEDSGSVVGYLVLQQGAHPAVESRNPIQLWQLYVVPAFHGSGVAVKLMSAAMDHARRHLNDVIWLGVSEHNARGIAFYRKHGFNARGLHQVGASDHAHQDVVMSCVVH